MKLTQKSGYLIESAAEVNRILKEVATYTIHGLSQPDANIKQFYLERIYISLGMSLVDVRKSLPWIEPGTPPSDDDNLEG